MSFPNAPAPFSVDAPAATAVGLLRRVTVSPVTYAVGYVAFMIPTYVLPYFGSNSHLLRSTAQAISTDMGRGGAGALSIPFYLHLLCLAALVALGTARGRQIGKPWLTVFPGLALAFDMLPVLSLIPLVPTVMHLAAIIVGVAVASGARAGAGTEA